jgi:hypothetical protein
VNLVHSSPDGLLALSEFIRSLEPIIKGRPHRIRIEAHSSHFFPFGGILPSKDL